MVESHIISTNSPIPLIWLSRCDTHLLCPSRGRFLMSSVRVFQFPLQGLPFGLVTGSLPLILSKRGDGVEGGSYQGAALLSISTIPYGLKLLWAPFVDTIFWSRLGRRRSYIVPCNLIASLLWWELSWNLDNMVVQASNEEGGLVWLSLRLFLIVLTMAVEDVAVDGWSLTVSKQRLSSAALAQTMGMTTGNLVTNFGALCGRTPECYESIGLREPVPLAAFALAAAGLHLIVTLVVGALTSEDEGSPSASQEIARLSIRQLGTGLARLWTRPHVKALCALLCWSRLAFSLSETNVLTSVEYVDAGGDLARLTGVIAMQYPAQIILGLAVSRRLSKGDPLAVWQSAHIALLVITLGLPVVMVLVTYLLAPDQGLSMNWGGTLLLGAYRALNNTVNKVIFITMGTFFNQITSESLSAGGTLVTLLNSLSNCGRFFPRAPAFWLADAAGPTVAATAIALFGWMQLPLVKRWLAGLQNTSGAWSIDNEEGHCQPKGGSLDVLALTKAV